MELEIETIIENEYIVLLIYGSLTIHTINDLTIFYEIINREKKYNLIIDLSSVILVDSSGVGILVGFKANMQKMGGGLIIVLKEEHELSLFNQKEIKDYFSIVFSLNTAISFIKNKP